MDEPTMLSLATLEGRWLGGPALVKEIAAL